MTKKAKTDAGDSLGPVIPSIEDQTGVLEEGDPEMPEGEFNALFEDLQASKNEVVRYYRSEERQLGGSLFVERDPTPFMNAPEEHHVEFKSVCQESIRRSASCSAS